LAKDHYKFLKNPLKRFVLYSFLIGYPKAGTCWQTHLGSGKCGQVFSTDISRSECCGSSQSFSYTDRELSSVEYFFATAIGGGVECSPCMGELHIGGLRIIRTYFGVYHIFQRAARASSAAQTRSA